MGRIFVAARALGLAQACLDAGAHGRRVVDAAVGYRLPNRFGFVTLEGRNLLDEEFKFQDTDPANPQIYPERLILARFTLAF